MKNRIRLCSWMLVCLVGAAAAPGCMGSGDARSLSAPSPIVEVSKATLDALAPSERLTVDLRSENRYRFDARAGAIDYSRIEIVDLVGNRMPMDRWRTQVATNLPEGRVFELAGRREAPPVAPDGVSVEALEVTVIIVTDGNGDIIAVGVFIEF
jgi:hypothetical protein